MKKLLSTFLIVAMVLCFMPTMAFAADSTFSIDANYNVAVSDVTDSTTMTVKVGGATGVYDINANALAPKGSVTAVWDAVKANSTPTNEAMKLAAGSKGTVRETTATLLVKAGTVYTIGTASYKTLYDATVSFKVKTGKFANTTVNLDDALFVKYLAKGINNMDDIDRTITVTFDVPSSGGGGGAVTPPSGGTTTTKPDGSTVTTTTTKDSATGVATVTEVTKDKSGQVTAEAQVSVPAQATVTGDKAEVAVSKAAEDKAIEHAKTAQEAAKKQGATAVETKIVVEIAGASKAEGLTVKLSADFAGKAEAAGAALDVKAGAANMSFDPSAVKALAQASGAIELSVAKDKKAPSEVSEFVKPGENEKSQVLNLSAKAGDKAITSFGGGVATIKVTDPGFAAPQTLYVADSGNAYARATKLVTEGTAKYVQFETKRFSTYVIVEQAVADKAIQATKDAKAKAGVEATTIKASSKAGKGYIKVNWKKSPGFKVDYYQVFRSTKKNSGYGTKAYYTTKDGKKTFYKNSKGLKKGARYYYKVRGVRIVDGQKVYTKDSNKTYKIAK